MLLWFVRLVIVLLIWRGLARLFAGIQEGLHGPRDVRARDAQPFDPLRAAPSGVEGQTPAVPLARDPICGTYVVPSRALTAGSGPDVHFFCSDDCRRAYAKRAS
jgi:YHS domain-containing protein